MRKWFGMLLMSMLLMAGCMQVSAAETGVLGAGGESDQIHRKQKSTHRWGSRQNRLLLIRRSI